METKEIKYGLGDDSINGITINKKIRDEEMFDYTIIHRESFIDELIRWISECKRDSEKTMMKDDLKYLLSIDDEYMFSSISTNEYICKDDDYFNQICTELLELNNSLKK